jgi:TQXA domain-containing protein/LPXTG-motif cell wall-anchored protein
MITAQRQRRRRRAAAAVASLAMAAGLVGGLALPAAAASEAEFVGGVPGQTGSVRGTIDGDSRRFDAGLFRLIIDGDTESTGYCIDILTPIENGAHLDEIDWDTSGVENLDIVEAILANYHPNGSGPDGYAIEGNDAQKAMATQSAIWHFTDGFDLAEGDPNDPVVVSNYQAILQAVADDALEGFGEPTVTLSIDSPSSTEGAAGELVGPYVINTSAASATLTPSDGVTLHNEDGSEFTGEVTDGTEVWLSSAAEGAGTITASAAAEVGAGRVFFIQGQQRLVLASTVTTDATAEAPVKFKTPPPTTTETTAPSTTTVPITPETTEVTVPPTEAPTTVPIVPAADTGGGLPVTGAQSLVLAAVALVLVAVGAGFGIVSRRKRLEGTES